MHQSSKANREDNGRNYDGDRNGNAASTKSKRKPSKACVMLLACESYLVCMSSLRVIRALKGLDFSVVIESDLVLKVHLLSFAKHSQVRLSVHLRSHRSVEQARSDAHRAHQRMAATELGTVRTTHILAAHEDLVSGHVEHAHQHAANVAAALAAAVHHQTVVLVGNRIRRMSLHLTKMAGAKSAREQQVQAQTYM